VYNVDEWVSASSEMVTEVARERGMGRLVDDEESKRFVLP
jgi:hypothetical protein